MDRQVPMISVSESAPQQCGEWPPSAASASSRANVAIVAMVALAAFAMALQPVRSQDVWHHVKCGWLVAQQGGPARTDVFSCTANGKSWIQYEWLAQYLIYLAHEYNGILGLVLWRALGVAIAALLLTLASRVREDTSWAAAGCAVAFAMCGGSARFYTRPEIFTWVLFAALMLVFEKLRTPSSKRSSLILALLCAAIVGAWGNMHGAWPAGLAWMGLMCAGETLSLLLKHPSALPRRTVICLWMTLGLVTLATLLNPYGIRVWEVPLKLSLSAQVREKIGEWGRADLDFWLSPQHLGIAVCVAVIALAPQALGWGDWLTLTAFGILALTARRHISLAMFAIAPLLARQLGCVVGRYGKGLSRIPLFLRIRFAVVIVAMLCAGLLTVALGGWRLPRADLGLREKNYPLGAARFVRDHGLKGNLFNSYGFGNYLLYALYPDNLVFIDGRIDMYGEDVAQIYDNVINAREGFWGCFEKYSIDICVVPAGLELPSKLLGALYKVADWKLVYWDDNAAVYTRGTPRRKEFFEGRHIYSVLPHVQNTDILRGGADFVLAERDYRHKLAEDPDCATALIGLAYCLMARNDMTGAAAVFLKAHAVHPELAAVTYELGLLMGRLQRFDEAAYWFRQTIEKGRFERQSYKGLGVVCLHAGRLDNAFRATRKAIRLNPQDWEAQWNLSMILEAQEKLDEAISAMDEVVRLDPQNASAQLRMQSLKRKRESGS